MYTACTSSAPKSSIRPASSYDTRTTSIFPADLLYLSLMRTSVREVHDVPAGKKNEAASSAINQSSRKRTGQVIATESPSSMLHTPRGFSALSFVHEGTLLLNGQSLFFRYRSASCEKLSVGNPNTSASGCFGI